MAMLNTKPLCFSRSCYSRFNALCLDSSHLNLFCFLFALFLTEFVSGSKILGI